MLDQWLATIEARMMEGETFDQIEDEINDDISLNEAQKSALWLYAWSCQTGAHQRYIARHTALGLEVDGSD